MSHAVIRLASEVSEEYKTHFPHGSEFLLPAAPVLRSHYGADHTAPYIMAIVPVTHPNAFGTNNVPSGNICEDTKQSFGDTQGSRGKNWLNATLKFVPTAHTAIVNNRGTLASILLTITP